MTSLNIIEHGNTIQNQIYSIILLFYLHLSDLKAKE